jgi:hypothetical protein
MFRLFYLRKKRLRCSLHRRLCAPQNTSRRREEFSDCRKWHTIRRSRSSYYIDWVITVRPWRPWQTNIRMYQTEVKCGTQQRFKQAHGGTETYEFIHNSVVQWNEMNCMKVTRGSVRCEAFFRQDEVLRSAWLTDVLCQGDSWWEENVEKSYLCLSKHNSSKKYKVV